MNHKELVEQIAKYNDISVEKYSHIQNLDNKITKLESHISKLKDSDDYYTKFEQFASEKLDSIMKNRRWILALAVDAVIESLRNEPFKQMIVNDELTDEVNQDRLLNLCELLFDKLLKQLIQDMLQNPIQDIKAINMT